jgi:hypothetical protein
MAQETYFKNFNTIQYGNSTSNVAIVDITERIVTLQNTENNPYIFYPLDITNGARADQIAYTNYEDAYASWILYLSNDIVDPYYEWYLTQDQFNNFIETKYGSIANAMQRTIFWRNNWVDQQSLSPTAYNSEIADNPERIKYWTPNVGPTGTVINYTRTQTDWTVSTNQLVSYTYTGNASFIVDELVNINGTGTAQVVQSNSTTLIVQHTINNIATSNGYIYGNQSQSNVTITGFSYLANTLGPNEIIYWTPVSYYDYENEKNEGNRTIRVMQPQYVPAYIKNVKSLLA